MKLETDRPEASRPAITPAELLGTIEIDIGEENWKAVEELQEAIKGMKEKLAALTKKAEETTESIETYIRRMYGDGQEDEPQKAKPTWIINAWELMQYANNTREKTIDANDIARFPRIDAVEVVRCKDCKHRPTFRDDEDGNWYVEGPKYQETLKNGLTVTLEDTRCPCVNGLDSYFSYIPEDDWFCKNGERRQENERSN